jgi:hypothetical protein
MGNQIVSIFDSKIKEREKKLAFKKKDTVEIKYKLCDHNLKDESSLNKYFDQIDLEKKKFQENLTKKYKLPDDSLREQFNINLNSQSVESFRLKNNIGSQIMNHCITETVEKHNTLKNLSTLKQEMLEEFEKYDEFAKPINFPKAEFKKIKNY